MVNILLLKKFNKLTLENISASKNDITDFVKKKPSDFDDI